jgi:hypothetical protein
MQEFSLLMTHTNRHCVGLSVRLAQDLGLYVTARALVEQGLISHAQLQARKNAFWLIYWHDKYLDSTSVSLTSEWS